MLSAAARPRSSLIPAQRVPPSLSLNDLVAVAAVGLKFGTDVRFLLR
jgi:hypothetical protein